MKPDFAVVTFGQHYSLLKKKDVGGKTILYVSAIP
jgi:hypothetical protein